LPPALSTADLASSHSGPFSRLNSSLLPRVAFSVRSFARRILLLALLLACEAAVLGVWIVHQTQVIGTRHDWGAFLIRCAVAFAAIFVPLGYLKNKAALAEILGRIERHPPRWGFLAAHCGAMLVFTKLSSLLYMGGGLRRPDLLAVGWLVAGIAAIAFAAFAFLSRPVWIGLIRGAGPLWAYASVAVVSAIIAAPYFRQWLWRPGPAIDLTFRLTRMFLSLFVSGIVANPSTGVIGTPRFRVQILPGCSGLEGVGLILAFGILWLVIFRKECRFPRSLVLLPLGVVLMFLFNAARIAALVLIGNAGAGQIAVNGFHSQAGWIAFSAVCVGFCFAAQRVPWLAAPGGAQPLAGAPSATVARNPTAAYLLPFLVILAASMISAATAGAARFEWLYPLRFFAAVVALWVFRRTYARLNWTFDWTAPAGGALVFFVWIALDRLVGSGSDRGFSAALFAFAAPARILWISLRVLAAVITVPLAEELAFRGFLMRRLIAPHFESVSFRNFSWIALLVSSVAFGLLHGRYWVAGTVAGILFGLVLVRRGRIGDAVVAHATANALLAAYVLVYHQWHLW
jgi:exosortase E/protease (VPEID-CTERM system)